MKYQYRTHFTVGTLGLLILILDAKTVTAGMLHGLELCLKTLIPALYPFCVLSMLITDAAVGRRIRFLEPIGKLFGVPKGAESLLLVGWLGGYPVGAQNVAAAFRQGYLSKQDAQRMAVICNNPGPSFLFGVLGSVIPDKRRLWLLWGILIAGSLLTAQLMPSRESKATCSVGNSFRSFAAILRDTAVSMVNICSCVVFFRMVLEFLNRWVLWVFPDFLTVVISGILELSNGCILLANLDNPCGALIIAAVLLSFGGLCVWMQTGSVCKGLDINNYICWKCIQAIICGSLAAAFSVPGATRFLIIIPLAVAAVLKYILSPGKKKDIALSESLLYNE